MAKRIQSPSSINTYRQCPRKYYYSYIEKIKTLPNIHLLRGSALHKVLEDFFNIDVSNVSKENYEFELGIIAHESFKREWETKRDELSKLGLQDAQLAFYYKESKDMLDNWLKRFFDKLKKEEEFVSGFERIKPLTEVYFKSEEHGLQGFIDAIEDVEGKISLIDYKTSKRDHMSEDYRLQLAIYALMYYEKYDKLVAKVGIDFLRHGERYLDVDEELLEFARQEAKMIHENTVSDDKSDYPIKESPLCGWCDFENMCGRKS
ncbi:PD-(D/E)XK nuclease family protein [Candidatus Woesearchaeota archaeon]|nr:PD-(D/E)XK nuclease family protein [Candidatus Woesearchaeota archaeon]MBL7051065.1 PD-(D/E)XK nuclease family protein [Candidatus Woesearchaeota archaeon]